MVYELPNNFSNGTAVVDIGTLAQYANYVSSNNLAAALLTVIFFISFAIGLVNGSGGALLFAGYITTIFGLILVRLSLLPIDFFWVIGGLTLAGAVINYWQNQGR
tara:strand:- start:276 stop:590 length:315 start_codon:yes stop_codon:yes gene_type:complete